MPGYGQIPVPKRPADGGGWAVRASLSRFRLAGHLRAHRSSGRSATPVDIHPEIAHRLRETGDAVVTAGFRDGLTAESAGTPGPV